MIYYFWYEASIFTPVVSMAGVFIEKIGGLFMLLKLNLVYCAV